MVNGVLVSSDAVVGLELGERTGVDPILVVHRVHSYASLALEEDIVVVLLLL